VSVAWSAMCSKRAANPPNVSNWIAPRPCLLLAGLWRHSLTSASINEQVIALAGTITKKDGFPYQLTGTYTMVGGCASGDQGNVTGYSVGAFNGSWYGNLTTAGGADIDWGTDQLGQVWPQLGGRLWPNREF